MDLGFPVWLRLLISTLFVVLASSAARRGWGLTPFFVIAAVSVAGWAAARFGTGTWTQVPPVVFAMPYVVEVLVLIYMNLRPRTLRRLR